MPRLVLDGVPLVPAAKPEPAKPEIHDDTDLASWAALSWTLAMLDAWDAQDRARQAVAVAERVQNGESWLRSHGADHPRHATNRVLLLNLRDRLDAELLAVRCHERACWFRCVEVHGFLTNAGLPTRTPEGLWRDLMGERSVPDLEYIDGCLVVRPVHKSGAALWQLQELRELAEAKKGRVVSVRPEQVVAETRQETADAAEMDTERTGTPARDDRGRHDAG